jgi:hypothetical protein
MDSILTTIKQLVGLEADYTEFDLDISTYINMALMTLKQLAVCSEDSVSVYDAATTWNEVFGDMKNIEGVKTYIYLRVKILFDPPTNTSVLEAMKQQISELEWRLNMQSERDSTTNETITK